ncbi:MAG: YcaO-like family protein, partial [Clostridia bacterium]|nr:YcaO-like family protein [Clostridia bacterium]
IINKQNQSYKTNVAADPVLEIAIQRTLTETFQGRTIKNFTSTQKGKILANVSDFPIKKNVINQLETSSGIFTADFFANEITCDKKVTEFEDRSHKSNKELLDYMVGLYRDLNLPVYVRNFSFLDFPSYRFIVPGFSEAVALKLSEPISEYAIADGVSKTLRDIWSADFGGLNWFRMYDSMVSNIFGRYTSFDRLAGLSISGEMTSLLFIYRAYTAYKLGQYNDAIKHIDTIKKFDSVDEELKGYFKCVQLYLTLKRDKVTDEKIKLIIIKFFEKRYVERFYSNLSAGSPFEEFLFKCDYNNCSECKYCERCSYKSIEELMQNIGKIYKSFIDGQSKEQFAI